MHTNETGNVAAATRQHVVDTKGASDYTGLAENTLIVMRSRGEGPRYIKYSRAVRYRVEDLREYVESRLRSNTSEVSA